MEILVGLLLVVGAIIFVWYSIKLAVKGVLTTIKLVFYGGVLLTVLAAALAVWWVFFHS